MMSCDNPRSTPAVWFSWAPATRIDVPSSEGTPSIDEEEFESWSGVASALDSCFSPVAAIMSREFEGRNLKDRRAERGGEEQV